MWPAHHTNNQTCESSRCRCGFPNEHSRVFLININSPAQSESCAPGWSWTLRRCCRHGCGCVPAAAAARLPRRPGRLPRSPGRALRPRPCRTSLVQGRARGQLPPPPPRPRTAAPLPPAAAPAACGGNGPGLSAAAAAVPAPAVIQPV